MSTSDEGYRTSVEEVKKLIDTSLSNQQIKMWIGIAHSLVDRIASRSDLPASTLEQIELLVTADLIQSYGESGSGGSGVPSFEDVTSISQESFSVSFEGQSDFGSLAMLLDPTGVLDPDETESIKQFGVEVPESR